MIAIIKTPCVLLHQSVIICSIIYKGMKHWVVNIYLLLDLLIISGAELIIQQDSCWILVLLDEMPKEAQVAASWNSWQKYT